MFVFVFEVVHSYVFCVLIGWLNYFLKWPFGFLNAKSLYSVFTLISIKNKNHITLNFKILLHGWKYFWKRIVRITSRRDPAWTTTGITQTNFINKEIASSSFSKMFIPLIMFSWCLANTFFAEQDKEIILDFRLQIPPVIKRGTSRRRLCSYGLVSETVIECWIFREHTNNISIE